MISIHSRFATGPFIDKVKSDSILRLLPKCHFAAVSSARGSLSILLDV